MNYWREQGKKNTGFTTKESWEEEPPEELKILFLGEEGKVGESIVDKM